MTHSVPQPYPGENPAAAQGTPPPSAPPRAGGVEHTRSSAAWGGLVLGCVLLILLLVFILQNGGQSTFHFLGFDFTLARGIALLMAAVIGAAVTALVGGIRILQLRRAYRRTRT